MNNKKKDYFPSDIDEKISKSNDYSQILGTYVISSNSIILGPTTNGIKFHSTEEEINLFVEHILEKLVMFSNIPSEIAPIEWVALPGVKKEILIEKYGKTKELSNELIQQDPNIMVIKKINNKDKKIIWISPDGMIGKGAHPTI
jgi:hypothetical protein